MFTVASDLKEVQKEKLTSSFFFQRLNVTAYTFEVV